MFSCTLERHILSQLNHTPVKQNTLLPKHSTASFPSSPIQIQTKGLNSAASL